MKVKTQTAVIIAIGLLCGPPGARAVEPEPPPASLSALLDEALAGNPEILSFKQRWNAAKEEIPQARSLDDPQLIFTQWSIPSNFNLAGADESWYGIGQSLPFPGKRSLKGTIAAKASEAAEQEYRAKILEITARVKAAYYQLFLIQQSRDLHLEHQALREEFIRIANQKYAVGQASQQELLKAQVELSKLHNSLLVLEQEQASAAAELNSLLNRPPGASFGRIKEPVYRPFDQAIDGLTAQALQNRPELKAASFMIEQSERARALAKKNYLPDFMVELMYWDVHGGSNKWQTNVKMTLPWIFTGKYAARARQTDAQAAQARAEQAALHNQTLFELRDLFTQVKTAEQLIDMYRHGVLPQAEQSLKSARIGYQTGKVDFLSLIDGERTLLDLQLEYAGAKVQFWQAIARLERSVGTAF
ncbi:MAG: TolC family protein [Nitrospirota bacterium]